MQNKMKMRKKKKKKKKNKINTYKQNNTTLILEKAPQRYNMTRRSTIRHKLNQGRGVKDKFGLAIVAKG